MFFLALSYLDPRNRNSSSPSSTLGFITSPCCSVKDWQSGMPRRTRPSSPIHFYSCPVEMVLACSAPATLSDTQENMVVICIAHSMVVKNHEDPNITQYYFCRVTTMSQVVFTMTSVCMTLQLECPTCMWEISSSWCHHCTNGNMISAAFKLVLLVWVSSLDYSQRGF